MMRRLIVLFAFLACAFAGAETSYLGLFLSGQRIGYSSSKEGTGTLDGATRKRLDSKTLIDAGLLGAAMKTIIDSTTWFGDAGRPVQMDFRVESAGRMQTTVAKFLESSIELKIDNNGALTNKTIPLPKDAPVVDDAVNAILSDASAIGSVKSYYVLDPMTASLVKNDVKIAGHESIKVGNLTTKAQVIEVSEPRATMRVYLSAKGDVIKIDGPMGIEMRPISESQALGASPKNTIPPDLAATTSIKLDKAVGDVSNISALNLRVSGADLSRLPSDAFQTVKKSGSSWAVTVHPVKIDPATTIAVARSQKGEWVKPTLNIPADSDEFKNVSTTVFAGAKTVADASKRVQQYVSSMMTPNAGIGVLRDAGEVLKTKEGVCRDYAVLTATILRAGGVPSRLASGLVMMDGRYYYHAWVEVWDGKKWCGVDSTRPAVRVAADHLKLAHGNVEDAFTFTFLDKVKVEVLNVRRD